jgi:hypothetical protein
MGRHLDISSAPLAPQAQRIGLWLIDLSAFLLVFRFLYEAEWPTGETPSLCVLIPSRKFVPNFWFTYLLMQELLDPAKPVILT